MLPVIPYQSWLSQFERTGGDGFLWLADIEVRDGFRELCRKPLSVILIFDPGSDSALRTKQTQKTSQRLIAFTCEQSSRWSYNQSDLPALCQGLLIAAHEILIQGIKKSAFIFDRSVFGDKSCALSAVYLCSNMGKAGAFVPLERYENSKSQIRFYLSQLEEVFLTHQIGFFDWLRHVFRTASGEVL